MDTPHLILAVDDDSSFLLSIKKLLKISGFNVRTTDNPMQVMDEIRNYNYSSVLLDIQMPGVTGIELIKQILAERPSIPIIVISGNSGIEIAVEAIKLGAFDFLQKPVDPERLMIVINNAIKHVTLNFEKEMLSREIELSHQIIGESTEIKQLRNEIAMIGITNVRVLILGESGTGKELVAWGIYHNSERKNKPYIKINCASIPHDLIESELFGYVKGAFTGATTNKMGKFKAADGGTLFLDEIGELDISLQAKLLRVLEENEIEVIGSNKTEKIDVRIITATNKNLPDLIKEGRFREDLFHRLNVARISVPPLRERREDIIPIAYYFLQKYNQEYNKKIMRITQQAEGVLRNHNWIGNIRELRNVIETIVVFKNNDTIELNDIINAFNRSGYTIPNELIKAESFTDLRTAKNNFEKQYINNVLKANDWMISKTAEILEIDRSNLFKKMKQYGIQKPNILEE
jgi:DNA-binding NtrC family response regulator